MAYHDALKLLTTAEITSAIVEGQALAPKLLSEWQGLHDGESPSDPWDSEFFNRQNPLGNPAGSVRAKAYQEVFNLAASAIWDEARVSGPFRE